MKVIVIGAGAAGMIAAGHAAELGHSVDVFEKNNIVGKKIRITGKGRCNITNASDVDEHIENIPGNPYFMYSALYKFSPDKLVELIEKLGVPTKVERGKRVFPVSDKAVDVSEALLGYMIKNGVLNKIFIEIYKDLEKVKKIGLSASLKDSSTITIRNENFKTKIYKIDKSLYFDEFGNIDGLICILDDITEQEKEINELMKKAIYDELTQIYNRRYFQSVLKNELEKVKRYNIDSCLLFFDIDFFKKINDNYGHDIGDLVLKNLSSLVKNSIRTTDQFFRIGGEEFAIILTNTTLKDATQVAEKIRIITKNYTFEKVGKITISIGVTKIKKTDTEELLYKRADEALYQSKKTGRNKVTVK